MSRSTENRVRDLTAQLGIQRAATAHYQRVLTRALNNLTLLGRVDIVRSITEEFHAELASSVTAAKIPEVPDDEPLF